MQLSDKYKNQTLSEGTLNPSDLIPDLLFILSKVSPKHYGQIMEDYRDSLPHTGKYDIFESDKFQEWIEKNPDDASYMLNEDIFYALNDIAPEGTYFGSHPGNGSDIGFWKIEFDE